MHSTLFFTLHFNIQVCNSHAICSKERDGRGNEEKKELAKTIRMWHKLLFSVRCRLYIVDCVRANVGFKLVQDLLLYFWLASESERENERIRLKFESKAKTKDKKSEKTKWETKTEKKHRRCESHLMQFVSLAIVFNLFSAYRKLNLLILFKRIQQSSIKFSWCWKWE